MSRLPANVVIVPLTRAHLPAVLTIQAQSFGQDGWPAWMIDNALRVGRHFRAAMAGQTLAGYAGLVIVGEQTAWLRSLAVRLNSQRRGIGTALLEDVLATAGSRTVGLEVATDSPAIRLYARHGFEKFTVRQGYYQPSGKDALVMLRRGVRR